MKKILTLILVFSLCISCFAAVFADENTLTAKLEVSSENVLVGDVITVNVALSGNTEKKLTAYDLAVFYNSSVVEYVAEEPIMIASELEQAGMSAIYTKADDSIIRFAAAFTPDTLDRKPAETKETSVICTLKFKAIADGDAKIRFAKESVTPKFSASLPEGMLVFIDNSTNESDVILEDTSVIVGEGVSVKMITEIVGTDKIIVPVGTSAEDVLKKLPEKVTVKLDDGSKADVKTNWSAGSLVSGYDADTTGEYFFTGNIDDSVEYCNYNKLFSVASVVVGDKDVEKSTEIVMIIGSKTPEVNGKTVETDVPAQIIDGRTFTPSRFVAEALGADVDWDNETKTVTVTNGITNIKLTIDSNIAVVNGIESKIDVPAQIVDGRTLTPSRFIAEALGADVGWDDETKTVKITA